MSNRATARKFMRPLVITDLPDSVQKMIRKRAREADISYEKAVAEFLGEANDAAILDEWFKENGENDDDGCVHRECGRR